MTNNKQTRRIKEYKKYVNFLIKYNFKKTIIFMVTSFVRRVVYRSERA